MRALAFLLRLLLVLFVNRRDGVGAFDLMIEFVGARAGGFLLVLLSADLRALLGGLLSLHLRALKNRACEWVDLRHIRIRGEACVYS